MSLKPEFFRYLDHFGKTVPVRTLHEERRRPNLVALRHDVDHDLDLALEMAYWESQRGCRATYFLLHTAPYWKDPLLLEKCLQLQDFNHEVGLHINVLSEWVEGRIEDVAGALHEILKQLRQGGVEIVGCSAHGDKACYRHGFINYWCLEELRPKDPEQQESSLSAEGIPAEAPEFSIRYPSSGRLTRSDGKSFPFWSVSTHELGLRYDATHVAHDHYHTDSGGAWKRSVDPISEPVRQGRRQILIHPIHWRGAQQIYFFLSTARSGSKWLAAMLDRASSPKGRHEFSLNHFWDGERMVPEKRTASQFTDLIENRAEAVELLSHVRIWLDSRVGDYAEANVYLERFLRELRQLFPEARFVHLHRNPRDVVRSLMNRDWYDTPFDDRHPHLPLAGWKSMSQFQKVCWYVRETQERLALMCDWEIGFERMVKDRGYLERTFNRLGLPFYPRLSSALFGQVINANPRSDFPAYASWTPPEKRVFNEICGPIAGSDFIVRAYYSFARQISRRIRRGLGPSKGEEIQRRTTKTIALTDLDSPEKSNLEGVGCTLLWESNGATIRPEASRHAYVLLGGGLWARQDSEDGWPALSGHYYRIELDAVVVGSSKTQLFCLSYDGQGELVFKRSLGMLEVGDRKARQFTFRPERRAQRFNVAVYMTREDLPETVVIRSFLIEAIPLVDTVE